MSKLEKRDILLNSIFNLSSTLSSLFLNVYLFVYAKSLPLMCIYTIIRIGLFPLFFIFSYKIAKRHSYSLIFVMGLILIGSSLLYALNATPLFEISPYYILIGASLTGMGEGFYWFASQACTQLVSTDDSRAKFLSYNGLFNYVGALIAPVLANIIITNSSNDMSAYRIILIIIFVQYVLVSLISLGINIKTEKKNVSLKESFSLKDPMWRDHNTAIVIHGLRNSLSLVLTSLLVYNAVGNGSAYSRLQSIFAFITIISFVFLSRILKRYIKTTFKYGVMIAILSTSILVLFDNIYVAIFFGISNALSVCFYDTSYSYSSAKIISHYMDDIDGRVVSREVCLSFGRCLGMAIIVLFYYILPEDIYLKVSVILLSSTSIFVYKFFIKYLKD